MRMIYSHMQQHGCISHMRKPPDAEQNMLLKVQIQAELISMSEDRRVAALRWGLPAGRGAGAGLLGC